MRQKHQLCQMLRPHNQRRSLLIACVEGTDTYLAEASMRGQALSWRCDWRQRKQLASVVICLPQCPAPPLLGPLLLTRVMRGGLALGEGCLSSLANTIADAAAWRVVFVCLCVCLGAEALYVTCKLQNCSDANKGKPFPGYIDPNSLVVQDEYVFVQVGNCPVCPVKSMVWGRKCQRFVGDFSRLLLERCF